MALASGSLSDTDPQPMAARSHTSPSITYRPISLHAHSHDTAQCLQILIRSWQQTYADLIDPATLSTLASRPYFSLHSLETRFADSHSLTWVATSRHEPDRNDAEDALDRSAKAPKSPLLRVLSPAAAHLAHPLALFRTRSRSSIEPEDEIVIGYATATLPVEPGGVRNLQGLYVSDGFQGHHAGSRLMEEVLGTVDPARLVCTEGNTRALEFYEVKGFR